MAATLRAWYRDGSDGNPQELHKTDPPQMLTAEQVLREAGVKYWRVENCNDEAEQYQLSQGYIMTDFMDISRQAMGDDFEKKTGIFYSEHLHEDAEIRLVVAGSGYFEIRSYDDRWIRLHLREGDLIHLPPGIYHRLALDSNEHIKFFRLFSEVPKWEAFFRPDADAHPAREKFMNTRPTAIAATS
ncbi:acireductone dioxygenase-like [Littorina saxatilis]|uniref:Acireductone dioxygenase n=1 Tax=Littorina saxatilis TaxID=31220 RepID=A0AAN9B6J1_9CAEN